MQRVLLIRALEEAIPLAKELASRNIKSDLYPLFKARFLPFKPLTRPQALLITSKNALRGIQSYAELKNIPLYVVGDKTAELASSFGFSKILSASGTSRELIQLILSKADPQEGILWHLSGARVKVDIVGILQAAGFEAMRRIIYDMESATELPSSLVTKLQNQLISHILFFSPHTTHIFVNLLKRNNLEMATSQITALCLSESVAKSACILTWEKLWISPKPTAQDLMEYFNEK